MIGTYEIRCHAAKPQMPLPPMFAFKDSPSSLRLLEIPKKIGNWNITTVKVAVNYPDNTTNIYTASRNGNVWVVTFNGCSITGKVANGLEVLADGIDENENAVNGYVLGVGDIYILDRDTDVEEAVSKHTMRYCDETPETPVGGDVVIDNGALKIYDGTQWISVDIDLSEYATKSELETAASALDNKIDTTKTELESSITEVESDIPTKTSELENDSGYITSASVPTKTSDLTNDSGYITSAQIIPSQTNVGNASMSDKSLLSQTLVNDVTDEHSTRVIVDEYDNVILQKYTTGWYVSKIEEGTGSPIVYTETDAYYAFVSDVRIEPSEGRLYYTVDCQDKRRNLISKHLYSYTTSYSADEFITTAIYWTPSEAGHSIIIQLTVKNAQTPVWVNVSRLVPDSSKNSGLLDTQITPNGRFVTPTLVKPYDAIPGYAKNSLGSLFLFGRDSSIIPNENKYVTMDFNNSDKLTQVERTYPSWYLSQFETTTFDPPLELKYRYVTTYTWRVGSRTFRQYIGSNCWVQHSGTKCYYIKADDDGNALPVFYVMSVEHPITFDQYEKNIETMDGETGNITCTREGTQTVISSQKYIAYEDELPTKVSDLTNDAGYLTTVSWNDVQNKPDIPSKTSDLTNDSDFTTNTALNAGLALKQDKLSDAQVSAINSVVDERTTVVKFVNDTVRTYDIVGEVTRGMLYEWEAESGSVVKEVKFGNTVTSIGHDLFYLREQLTKVTIPDSVTSIGSNAFYHCVSLTSIDIPDSVTNIGGQSFYESGLTSIHLPKNLKSLESLVFSSCNLASIDLPDGLASIKLGALEDNQHLQKLVIPESVTSIELNAFYDCNSLTSAVFEGKTISQVQSMANYPWGISDTSIIKTFNIASKEWVLEQLANL